MDRRTLLKLIAASTGAGLVNAPALAVWQEQPALVPVSKAGFDDATVALITELCETVIPRTDTPGAKDAGVPPFFIGMIRECYDEQQQQLFEAGFADIEARSKTLYGKPFATLGTTQKNDLITAIDAEAIAFNKGESGQWKGEQFTGQPHYFTLMKQLIIFGFFSSKVGGTKVLRHADVPGGYYDIPYNKGDKAWTTVWPW
ncbi:hypothetical protein BFC17_08545 [Alteromonas lipolytica]|uniref:Twin-arginine translocation pathway signal n=2 Tax=Alteromonas lipolytica TaxID=1856405 RepID=A0A1E8FK29_9ALTE|nr:hypothetical protein BFC17_08545 [Alteromonas lipolytica]